MLDCGTPEKVISRTEQTWHVIGERAFYQCRKLRGIPLEQVWSIGREALCGCSALAEVRFIRRWSRVSAHLRIPCWGRDWKTECMWWVIWWFPAKPALGK